MPMVHPCEFEECPTLTMGRFCLDHELLLAAEERLGLADASEPVAAERAAAELEVATL